MKYVLNIYIFYFYCDLSIAFKHSKCFSIIHYSEDINLSVFLDFEIWKVSYMLSQTLPVTQDSFECEHGLIDFVTGKSDIEELDEEEEYCYANKVDIEMEKKTSRSSLYKDNLFDN